MTAGEIDGRTSESASRPETASAVQDSAEALGGVLAELRRGVNLTGEALGRRLGMSQAKISKLERGVVRIKPQDVELIARELGVSSSETAALVERARFLQTAPLRSPTDEPVSGSPVPIQKGQDDPPLPGEGDVAQREVGAAYVRVIEVRTIPGLLQTSDYTRRIVNGYFRFAFGSSEPYWKDAQVAISHRADRQVQLYDPGKEFEFVLMEAALSSPLLTPGQMLGQIDRVEEVANLPGVTVRIVENSASPGYPLIHGFTLLDAGTMLVEVGRTSIVIRDLREIEFHRRIFDHYSELAVDDIGPLLEGYKARYAEAARPKD